MNRTSDYDYALPSDLIASHPLPDRAASRMLVLDRASGRISHHYFSDFPTFLQPGDLTVLNDSRVLRARLHSDDNRIEFLFLEERAPNEWIVLARPGKKLRPGGTVSVGGTTGHVLEVLPGGERVIRLEQPIDFDAHGELPIPPYMGRAADAADDERYQTVYADDPGSVAAPTAGLHFTPGVLKRIPHTFLTLHVGQGTFQPVKVDELTDHQMHEERYTISESAATAINTATRIVAIGTTTTRVLESQPPGPILPTSGRTSIFLHPPIELTRFDVLLTNFHLPKSTLLMLVSAFAGRDLIRTAYEEAIRERYRFYSYGDCMLIL
ncbi:MAG: tRNA preQ1(34) S-adenosylmethionine ribosyltransferase-isomerase QueA [Chthoniobacterales bacterium]